MGKTVYHRKNKSYLSITPYVCCLRHNNIVFQNVTILFHCCWGGCVCLFRGFGGFSFPSVQWWMELGNEPEGVETEILKWKNTWFLWNHNSDGMFSCGYLEISHCNCEFILSITWILYGIHSQVPSLISVDVELFSKVELNNSLWFNLSSYYIVIPYLDWECRIITCGCGCMEFWWLSL